MDASTTTTTTSATPANGGTDDASATPAKMYPTKADAEAAKPADAPKSLKAMEVSKSGAVVGWVLARGYDHGLAILARLEGYSVGTGGKVAPVTKEAVAAKLAEFTDAELAAMGLKRQPQRGKKS